MVSRAADEKTVVAPPEAITIADGEQRPVVRSWPDGTWECPFCFSPQTAEVTAGKPWPEPCGNPACLAGGNGTPERVTAVKAEWAHSADAVRHRVRLDALLEENRRRRELRRLAVVAEFVAEADVKGWCPRCWRHSTGSGSYPASARLVRHRDPANCPLEKRDEAKRSRA